MGNFQSAEPLSAEVLAHTPTIQRYASEYGIPEYVAVIQAIMMQESGGRGTDPMQSSDALIIPSIPIVREQFRMQTIPSMWEFSIMQTVSGSIPTAGSIIFFDWDHDGVSDHVGIVESCDGTTVYTVEGNSGDAVKENSYTVHSASIMGYGIVSGM